MYYSLFGRRSFQQSKICNCSPRPMNTQVNNPRQLNIQRASNCPNLSSNKYHKEHLIVEYATFGGISLPQIPEKRATFHVASLNLDTIGSKNISVQLAFACNIIVNNLKVQLRFQLFKQEKIQYSPVPISSGMVFSRNVISSEANGFTLTAFDYNFASTPCCYNVLVDIEHFQGDGNLILLNPILTATIARND